MIKIIIYGTGAIANYLVNYINLEQVEIVAYADSYQYNTEIKGIKVIRDTDICKENYDYVIIAFANVGKGMQNLLGMGIDKNKIIAYTPMSDKKYYDKLFSMCSSDLRSYLNDDLLNDFIGVEPTKYHLCTMHTHKNYNEIIERDYVREQTLGLLAEEIHRRRICGDVAELGVYKGEFSKKINVLFKERQLYMFDTFEGFDCNDIKTDETLLTEKTEENKFRDTSVQTVMDTMPYPEKCVVKKGYFPDTFDLYDKKFAFVSIDVDLYQPILKGLEIFYPRLEKGGYIIVHDYNSEGYRGVKKAVIDYCDKEDISYVPLCDNCGSIVITK